MTRLITSVCALISVVAAAAEEYKRFADVMNEYNFTWDAHKVTTDDGYILTTFHVTGNKDGAFKAT